MNSKIKDWMLPHVMTEFIDHKKQKHLVVVVVIPMGVALYNTTSTDIEVNRKLCKAHLITSLLLI